MSRLAGFSISLALLVGCTFTHNKFYDRDGAFIAQEVQKNLKNLALEGQKVFKSPTHHIQSQSDFLRA